MSIATLMTGGSQENPAFALEHRALHQIMVEAITPLSNYTQFVTEPGYFDPRSQEAGLPGSLWQIKHQNAHDDATRYLPPFYGSPAVGMNTGQNLVDSNLEEPSGLTWSLFVNLRLHYAAMLSIGP